MTDERNIAHDEKIADDKRDQGVTSSNDAVQAQPGRKPPQVDGDTDPSNSGASEMYKAGETPRDHSHESRRPSGGRCSTCSYGFRGRLIGSRPPPQRRVATWHAHCLD